jgi:dienelactone hydrolase
MHPVRTALAIVALFTACGFVRADDATASAGTGNHALPKPGDVFKANDSLHCGPEENADAAECIKGLCWTTAPFDVTCQPAWRDNGDWLVRFPSPVPVGDTANDLVSMEWRMAKNNDGTPRSAPAVVIVHESGRGMVAGRIFANGLRVYGIHTLLLHLPGYGARAPKVRPDIRSMLPALKQAIADARRARDAAAALPFIDDSNISVLGISLGGFVTSTVAGLDRGYSHHFILLAGGNLPDVILQGGKDAARVRQQLERAGVTEQQIREHSRHIEPMRLAQRVDPSRTWLFSGTKDEVVPPACSLAFAKAAGLVGKHHVELPVGHYSAAIMIPVILQQTADIVTGAAVAADPKPGTNKPAASDKAPDKALDKAPETLTDPD